jgi:hypothetical protein
MEKATHYIEVWKGMTRVYCQPIKNLKQALEFSKKTNIKTIAIFKIKLKEKK